MCRVLKVTRQGYYAWKTRPISNDVLEQEDVRKPALMRALFELGARFSGQEFSYNKMLGQLQDAGNTTTLAHYLTLLDKAAWPRSCARIPRRCALWSEAVQQGPSRWRTSSWAMSCCPGRDRVTT